VSTAGTQTSSDGCLEKTSFRPLIESLDDEGAVRYIEVKATSGDDPSDPFPISTAELRFAFQHRSEYSIYRVTGVKSSTPRIHRYGDPFGELEAQRGYLRTSKALMSLPTPQDEDDQTP
jgi:Protein NO VEIN, C-terminal